MPPMNSTRQNRLCLETLEDRIVPATFSFAGFTFEQDSTPDVETFIQPATVEGAIVTSVPTNATDSVVFPDQPAVGFNTTLTLGTPLNNTGTSRALNLPSTNNGTTARSGLELSWSGGRGLANLTGDDLVFYESGTNSTSPEAFMVQVFNATTNAWTSWYYEPADSFATYGGVGTEGAFATAIDLNNLGVGTGEIISRIRLVNMTDEDRMVNASGIGAVIPEDNGATSSNFPAPGPLASFTNYGSNTLDPDPLYVGAFHALSNTLVDVAVTKTSPQTTVAVGEVLTYTITVSNAGSSAANNVTLADTFPADLDNVSWTSQANGGATGNNANGAGNINEILNLPVGASVVYTVTATLGPTALTSLSNTATVTVDAGNTDSNPANNSATETDAIGATLVDIAVTKTSPQTTIAVGTPFTYTITVSNVGGAAANNVTLADVFPAALANVTWTSQANGGATGNTANGAGDLNETLNLPVGASIVYTVTSTLAVPTSLTLANTATATVDAFSTDTNPADNTATETDDVWFHPAFALNPAPDLYTPHPTANSNQAFIQGLYHQVLGREGSAGEVDGWVQQLNNGLSRQAVVTGFVNSQEHRQEQVEYYYQTFLGRTAVGDPGATGWVNLLLATQDESQVITGILTSAEFTNAHPSNADFVTQLYQQLLGREPDAGGLASWEAQLAGGASRASVVQAFLHSAEGAGLATESLYVGYFHRPSDAGSAGAEAALQSGSLTYSALMVSFLSSAENDAQAAQNVP